MFRFLFSFINNKDFIIEFILNNMKIKKYV